MTAHAPISPAEADRRCIDTLAVVASDGVPRHPNIAAARLLKADAQVAPEGAPLTDLVRLYYAVDPYDADACADATEDMRTLTEMLIQTFAPGDECEWGDRYDRARERIVDAALSDAA